SGSILQVPVDESDTEFIVATVQDEHSGARWINSRGLTETHAYEFPFNLRLGGEVVQVTACEPAGWDDFRRSEEHTSELQSRENLVCRLLLEKKKNTTRVTVNHANAQE